MLFILMSNSFFLLTWGNGVFIVISTKGNTMDKHFAYICLLQQQHMSFCMCLNWMIAEGIAAHKLTKITTAILKIEQQYKNFIREN